MAAKLEQNVNKEGEIDPQSAPARRCKLKGIRGKYATRYQSGANLVLLSPDVAEYFP